MRITTIGATATAVAVLASPITSTPAPTPATVPAVPAASVVSKLYEGRERPRGGAHLLHRVDPRRHPLHHPRRTDAVHPADAPTAPEGLSTDARGTLKFSHSRGEVTGWAEATVDCLVTSGRTATLTAVVTKSNVEEPGARLGISVQQGGKGEPDRLGFSWGVVNVDPENIDENGQLVRPQAGSCMAPAPFTTVIKGGYKVIHAEITKSPTQPEPTPHHS